MPVIPSSLRRSRRRIEGRSTPLWNAHARLNGIRAFLNRHRLLVLGTFAIFLIVGLLSFSDYGISSDEPMGLWFGYHTYGYLFLGLPVPQQPDWTFYGPAWQLMLAIANEVMGSLTGERLWLTRHFLNFGLFFAGTVVFYRIGKRCLKSEKFALLATVFLMLSPRIFAHSFHNPKDMPAMIFFLFAIASMFWFLERRSLIVMLLHTVLCAVLISMRMFGLIVPLLTLSFVILERNRRAIRDAAIYGLLLCVMIITVWPVLWSVNPLVRFSEALGDTAGRPGGGLYFGELVTGNPWHYIPVWIFITTPILYSCAFAIGCGAVIRDVIARPLQALHAKTDLTLLAWFFVPLAALIILRIGIFDEWRHVLFLYPAFLLIGMRGIEWLFGWMGARRMVIGSRALAGVITVSLLWTGYWMFTRHPYEYMYFSVPSRFVEGKFEMDYWSLGSRDALQWILNHDRTPVVKVYPSGRIARIAADTLPLNGWARIEWSDPDKADYIIDNFRGNNYVPTMPTDREIHIIKIDGLPIVGIYKGPDTQGIYKPHLWLEDQVPMP